MKELLFDDDGLKSWNTAFESRARTLQTSVRFYASFLKYLEAHEELSEMLHLCRAKKKSCVPRNAAVLINVAER